MSPPPQRVFLWTGLLVVIGWALVAFMDPDPPRGTLEAFSLGIFFGTMFGHTTAAAAWAALGPGLLLVRLPLALLWVVMLPAALAINIGIHSGPGVEFAVLFSGYLFGQWLLVQLPLWLLVILFGLKLRYRVASSMTSDPRDWQFGIRQLMIVTAMVAIAVGIGRLVVIHFGDRVRESGPDGPILAFLVVVAVVLSLLPLLASLLPRYSVWATLGTLIVLALATAMEANLARQLGLGPRPNVWDYIALNVTTVAWVLLFASVVRWSGYALGTPRAEN